MSRTRPAGITFVDQLGLASAIREQATGYYLKEELEIALELPAAPKPACEPRRPAWADFLEGFDYRPNLAGLADGGAVFGIAQAVREV